MAKANERFVEINDSFVKGRNTKRILIVILVFFASREIFEDFFVLPQEGLFRREFTLSKDSKKIYFHFHQNRQQVVLKIDNPFF